MLRVCGLLAALMVAPTTVGRPLKREGGAKEKVAAWYVPCKKWDEHATYINDDVLERMISKQGNLANHGAADSEEGFRAGPRKPSFGLAILTRSRGSVSSMPFFGVALGSVLGQGVFSGPIHVVFTGDHWRTRYIGRAAAAWKASARVVPHITTELAKGTKETSSSSTQGMQLEIGKVRSQAELITYASASNYIQALEVDYGAASSLDHDQPVLLLDDDLIVSAIFELRLDGLLRTIRGKLPGARFILSLYTTHPSVDEWVRLVPGVVEHPLEHLQVTNALVFSSKSVRADVARCFRAACLPSTKAPCSKEAAVLRHCLRTQPKENTKIQLLGLQHAIVQLNLPESQTAPSSVGAANYIDTRRPCSSQPTSWVN